MWFGVGCLVPLSTSWSCVSAIVTNAYPCSSPTHRTVPDIASYYGSSSAEAELKLNGINFAYSVVVTVLNRTLQVRWAY